MLIPIGTDRPLRRPTLVTPLLIGINVAIFLAQSLLHRSNPEAYLRLLSPLMVDGSHFRVWTLLTYQFLHADWMHVLGNMLFLWVFGPCVEDRLTRAGYLAFYLVGGVVAGGAHALFDRGSALGASGAIAAVTGAFIVLFPRTHVRCILFFIIIGIYQIPAWIFIVFAIAKDVVFAGLGGGGIAHMAHIGGYTYGLIVSLALLWGRVLSREPYDLFTIGRQAYRRRQLKDAAHVREKHEADSGVRRVAGTNGVDDGPVARARAEVATLLSQDRAAEAAMAYKALVNAHADAPQACTLSRRHQLDLANHFFAAGDHEAASYAYDRFLVAYPRDPEAPRVRLLLALINARFLNDPIRARQLLTGLEATLVDDEQRGLARTLQIELG